MGRVEMDHGPIMRAHLIDTAMQERLFRWLVPVEVAPFVVELSDPSWVELAEPCIGWREQPTIIELNADVAGTAVGKTQLREHLAEFDNLLPEVSFTAHDVRSPL